MYIKFTPTCLVLIYHLQGILVIKQLVLKKYCFIIGLLYSSTCFEHYVLIIRRSKLYYTVSGIVTLCRWPSGARVERGDIRCCIIQFWPPVDEHTVLETCRGL